MVAGDGGRGTTIPRALRFARRLCDAQVSWRVMGPFGKMQIKSAYCGESRVTRGTVNNSAAFPRVHAPTRAHPHRIYVRETVEIPRGAAACMACARHGLHSGVVSGRQCFRAHRAAVSAVNGRVLFERNRQCCGSVVGSTWHGIDQSDVWEPPHASDPRGNVVWTCFGSVGRQWCPPHNINNSVSQPRDLRG